MVRTGTAFAVILYDIVRRFGNTMLRRMLRPKEGGRLSDMEQAMESYRKCLPYGTSYGDLRKVSKLCSLLWRATGSASFMQQAMESPKKCLRHGTSYGAIRSVSLMENYRMSPLRSQVWTAKGRLSIMEPSMESYRMCLRMEPPMKNQRACLYYGASYGEL